MKTTRSMKPAEYVRVITAAHKKGQKTIAKKKSRLGNTLSPAHDHCRGRLPERRAIPTGRGPFSGLLRAFKKLPQGPATFAPIPQHKLARYPRSITVPPGFISTDRGARRITFKNPPAKQTWRTAARNNNRLNFCKAHNLPARPVR